MLLWYRTLAYLALHREANLILSNGKVTALPTVFNPVVKLARAEAYRQERAASSTKLFTRQSSKQLLSGQNAYGVWNVSRVHRNILSAPRGKSKRRRQKKAGEQQAVPGGCPSLCSHETCWARRPRAHHQAGHATRRTKHFRESLPLLLAAFHCKLSSFNQNTGICMFE